MGIDNIIIEWTFDNSYLCATLCLRKVCLYVYSAYVQVITMIVFIEPGGRTPKM